MVWIFFYFFFENFFIFGKLFYFLKKFFERGSIVCFWPILTKKKGVIMIL